MCKSKIMIVAVAGWFLCEATALAQSQVTNIIVQPLPTKLETLESTVGKVVLKGRTEVGTVATPTAGITIFLKENSLVGEITKEHGIIVVFKVNEQPDDRTLIDYDELESLSAALDYLSRIDWSATTMASFDASYTSKAGLRVDSYSSRRSGKIEFSMRSSQMTRGINLAPEHLAQIRSLIDQAKRKLDELRRA